MTQTIRKALVVDDSRLARIALSKQLQKRGIEVARNYVGEYCTSLEMAGASLTLVRLDDELDKLLGAPAEIPIRVF